MGALAIHGELSRAREKVAELETETRDAERQKRRELHKQLRRQGRLLEERIQDGEIELKRLTDEAEPLWTRMRQIVAEYGALNPEGRAIPSEIPTNDLGQMNVNRADRFNYEPYSSKKRPSVLSLFASDEEVSELASHVKSLEVEFKGNEQRRKEIGAACSSWDLTLERMKGELRGVLNQIERLEEIEAMTA